MFGCVLLAVGESHAQKAAPYPVGAVFDLTGIISSIGGPEKRGLEIAVDAVNAAGGVNGRQLKMTVYDSESNATKGVTETKRLIDVDKVIAGLGYSSTGVTMAAIQTVESGNMVMLGGGASEKIWIPTKKWVFTVVPRQREASIPVLLEVLQQRGAKKIAYINIDNTFGQTGREVFDWAVKEMKITPAIVEKYAVGSTDVGPQMTHIKAAGADGLLITGQMADTVMVIKNARDQGFTGPIVADYSIVGPEFIDLAGKYGEGIVTTSIKTLVAPDLPDNDASEEGCHGPVQQVYEAIRDLQSLCRPRLGPGLPAGYGIKEGRPEARPGQGRGPGEDTGATPGQSRDDKRFCGTERYFQLFPGQS